jgi:hypothetical protein
MSVEVGLGDLRAELARHGPVAFLVTVGEDGGPHVVSVLVDEEAGALTAPAGRTTAKNVAARPAVSLLWPGPPGDGYCLIVDGPARLVRADGDGEASVIVEPVRAVRHRLAAADDAGPSCITVLDRRPS